MSEIRRAVYPASFDPITNGHLDLIERASRLFDEVIVGVALNLEKDGLFSFEERMEMLREVLSDRPNLRVDSIDGLLVDYARATAAQVVIRGLRALSDFEYEFEMTQMNHHMNPELETVFLMTSEKWFYVSSSRLRELVRFGRTVDEWVPPVVANRLQERRVASSPKS